MYFRSLFTTLIFGSPGQKGALDNSVRGTLWELGYYIASVQYYIGIRDFKSIQGKAETNICLSYVKDSMDWTYNTLWYDTPASAVANHDSCRHMDSLC